MSDLERFNELVDDIWEMVFGTERRPETKRNGDRRSEDRGTPDRREKPKRARTKKGTYRADDKSTKDVNEAWVGGKAPTRKELLGLKKKKTKRKTKGKK